MKEELKQLVLYQLVLYRTERAKEAIEEAELLFSKGHIRTSVNRLYYACFYAASAILLAKGYSSAKHSGIRSLFYQKLVKTGWSVLRLGLCTTGFSMPGRRPIMQT
ncbi:MAG: HEPN domain-containing protein [Moorellaceae bacterium]